jgi:DNA invertase Pin-like site-specific DNA recombinase
MMIIGYARTSTVEQEAGLDAQIRDLQTLGVERIFSEQTSSIGPRAQLEAALDFIRDGDVLVVIKLDRLARSVADMCRIVERVLAKGASLRIQSMGIDTSTPTGKLMLNVIGAVAQFEREVMLERQLEGIAKAKREGKYKGRKPTALAQAEDVRRLRAEGLRQAEIARRLKIGEASVSRILARPASEASN